MEIPIAMCIRKVKDFSLYSISSGVAKALDEAELLIVPHNEDEFRLPQHLAARTHYVGLITSRLPEHPIHVSLELNCPGKTVIVITGGGGGSDDAVYFYNLALDSIKILAKTHPHIVGLLITGPLFTQWAQLRLHEHVQVRPAFPKLTDIFATADLVISQAGYNTIGELCSLGTPTICIPGERGFDDQLERAVKYASVCKNIHMFLSKDPASLAEKSQAVLLGQHQRTRIQQNGADSAAALLFNKMQDRVTECNLS